MSINSEQDIYRKILQRIEAFEQRVASSVKH